MHKTLEAHKCLWITSYYITLWAPGGTMLNTQGDTTMILWMYQPFISNQRYSTESHYNAIIAMHDFHGCIIRNKCMKSLLFSSITSVHVSCQIQHYITTCVVHKCYINVTAWLCTHVCGIHFQYPPINRKYATLIRLISSCYGSATQYMYEVWWYVYGVNFLQQLLSMTAIIDQYSPPR